MRDIEFRGFDIRVGMYLPAGDESQTINETFKLSNSIIMQYTGLKDSKGVKIFEGDIIKWNGYNAVVVYKTANARFEAHEARHTIGAHKFHLAEVIGNIHENPELITS